MPTSLDAYPMDAALDSTTNYPMFRDPNPNARQSAIATTHFAMTDTGLVPEGISHDSSLKAIVSAQVGHPHSTELCLGARHPPVPAQEECHLGGSFNDGVHCMPTNCESQPSYRNVEGMEASFDKLRAPGMDPGLIPLSLEPQCIVSFMDEFTENDLLLDAIEGLNQPLGDDNGNVELVPAEQQYVSTMHQQHSHAIARAQVHTKPEPRDQTHTIQFTRHAADILGSSGIDKSTYQQTAPTRFTPALQRPNRQSGIAITAPKSEPPLACGAAITKKTKAKKIDKRKPRTYSQAVPSQHCHICSRRPTQASPHAVCGNLGEGRCRKTICEKCFYQFKWDLAAARAAPAGTWKCPHCRGECPTRAQCFIYDRTSQRRRKNLINHRKRKLGEVNREAIENIPTGGDGGCAPGPAPSKAEANAGGVKGKNSKDRKGTQTFELSPKSGTTAALNRKQYVASLPRLISKESVLGSGRDLKQPGSDSFPARLASAAALPCASLPVQKSPKSNSKTGGMASVFASASSFASKPPPSNKRKQSNGLAKKSGVTKATRSKKTNVVGKGKNPITDSAATMMNTSHIPPKGPAQSLNSVEKRARDGLEVTASQPIDTQQTLSDTKPEMKMMLETAVVGFDASNELDIALPNLDTNALTAVLTLSPRSTAVLDSMPLLLADFGREHAGDWTDGVLFGTPEENANVLHLDGYACDGGLNFFED